MRVNQNISAVISNANLHQAENKLTASIERLSSGYKLNKAKDSPAGMAISNKMRAQIKGLDQSNKNAADGTSVMQTADGALNETHSMLQRMRELCVQAANGTMSIADKKACQNEIQELQEEIDRIAKDTEFNGKRILDGSQDYRAFPSVDVNGVSKLASTYIRNFQTSDEVPAENYKFDITTLPEQATRNFTITPPASGTLEINGTAVEITSTDTSKDIYAMLKEAGEYVGVMVEWNGADNYSLKTFDYGQSAKISITDEKGITNLTEADLEAMGKDTEITMKQDAGEGFTKTATYLSDGKKVTIRDLNGFEMIFEVDPEMDTQNVMAAGNPVTVDLEMTDIGSMTLQIGTHENQIVDVRIPAATCEALYIDELNVVRKGSAEKAMRSLDDAIAQVSAIRSRIGAYQNRLDYAVASLDGTEENMEAAISRIMDTDMAEEMSVYSNMNVLDQAGISVLSQANDMPQQILQLLQ